MVYAVNCKNGAWASAASRAASLIKQARNMVLLSGAGLSADSGLDDIRTKSGWRFDMDSRSVATIEAMECRYDLFHHFFSERVHLMRDIVPHDGHYILAEWEKRGLLSFIGTLNEDRLHQAADSCNVHELFGTFRTFRCHACGNPHPEEAFLLKETCRCGGKLRPDVVLFGESLPEEAWCRTRYAIRKADLVMVIGTSLRLDAANRLASLSRAPRIFVNAEKTGYENRFDVFIEGRAIDALSEIQEWMDLLE